MLAWQAADAQGFATHTASLALLARYLVAELGCEVLILGIESATMELAAPLSHPVAAAVARVSAFLVELAADSGA